LIGLYAGIRGCALAMLIIAITILFRFDYLFLNSLIAIA
jgi:hypothetical protein